ncbi:hypothetical protein DRJ16_05240 [Candidatus Woesearchaeota archaeon]|nr:MAG: hypothetical protein DRJ16_05240 [Candidatus Woesearchaeota archaeon]
MNNEKKNAIKDAANDVRNLIEKFSAKRYKEKPSEELQADLVITLDIFHKELTSKLMADMPKKLIKKIEERRKKL